MKVFSLAGAGEPADSTWGFRGSPYVTGMRRPNKGEFSLSLSGSSDEMRYRTALPTSPTSRARVPGRVAWHAADARPLTDPRPPSQAKMILLWKCSASVAAGWARRGEEDRALAGWERRWCTAGGPHGTDGSWCGGDRRSASCSRQPEELRRGPFTRDRCTPQGDTFIGKLQTLRWV